MRGLIAAVLLPFAEIAGLVLMGQAIGVWGVLGLIALAAVAGVMLIRGTGTQALASLRSQMARGEDPGQAMVTTALRLFAGGLLIIPGFLTDIVALLLLLPPVQALIAGRLRARVAVMAARAERGPARETVIDGEFYEVPPKRPTHEPSGWTRH